jgi:hypothetical protein
MAVSMRVRAVSFLDEEDVDDPDACDSMSIGDV